MIENLIISLQFSKNLTMMTTINEYDDSSCNQVEQYLNIII